MSHFGPISAQESERRDKAHLEYLKSKNIRQIPIEQITDDFYPEDFEQPRDPDPPAECQIYSEAYTPHL